ncbi:MAG: response regulator [Deltaproteobacteria bacterium]|nr:response regulator [Deltaproteobacteria bacterium]
MSKIKILVVEDEAIVARDLKNSLENLNYEVPAVTASGEKAVAMALALSPDLVLVDIMLKGDMDGIEAVARIRKEIDLPAIYLTAYTDDDTLKRAKITTPLGYILKPFDERELHTAIEMGLYKHKMEMELKRSKEWLLTVLKSIGDAVIATDNNGRVTFMNPVAENLTGWNQVDASGLNLAETFNIVNEQTNAVVKNPLDKVLKNGVIVGLAKHTMLISKNGSTRPIDYSVAPVKDEKGNVSGVVLVFRDVTEKKRVEQERLKTQKLESLGILAGGIAHDFNNILTGILGNITLSKMYLDANDKAYNKLEDAEKASLLAKDLTQQLLTFAKGGAPIKETVSVRKIIDESAYFVLCGSNVKCDCAIPDNLRPLKADAGQLSQVISNLVINANQSMPQGGIIKITAENIDIDHKSGLSIKPGQYIKINVKDMGHGIPNEYLAKIFDPYFTTKQAGNGLGLATVFSIINRHNGYIFVESVIGKGTTFFIYLPVSTETVIHKKKKKNIIAGKGRILVMDDEAMVLEVSAAMIKSLGYETAFAANGAEAVAKYKEAMDIGKPFDIVVLDLTVQGGMGGRGAIKRLLEINPQVKAIVSSGYSVDSAMAQFEEYGFIDVLAKPYKLETLGKTLHRVNEI